MHPCSGARRFPLDSNPERPIKPIAVAVICRDGRVLVQRRRSEDQFNGLWEFPGGKIEPHETPEQAAVRECREEIGRAVRAVRRLDPVVHDYADFTVRIYPIVCEPDESIQTESARSDEIEWLPLEELRKRPIPEANHALIDGIERAMSV